jgi:hypothetical protein
VHVVGQQVNDLSPRGAAVPLLDDVADSDPIEDPWVIPTFAAVRPDRYLWDSGKSRTGAFRRTENVWQ